MSTLTTEEIIAKVERISYPLLAAANVDLVELSVDVHKEDVMLQFMADKPIGGITIQECADLNHAIVAAIDADGFLGESYSLEFSSPGLDRPLVTQKDFLRNMDRQVRVELKEAIASKKGWVGKIIRVENVHMGDIGAPSAAPNQDPNSIDGRPGFPYTSGTSLGIDYQNRISSDDTHSPFNQTLYPFLAQGYTFYKTIRFSPAGEASINGTYSARRVAEIGLIPTRGSTLDVNNRNVIAIQFSGMAGNFKIFRR